MKTELLKHALRDDREVVEYQIRPGEMMDGQTLKICKDGRLSGLLPMGAVYEDGHNYMYAYTDKRDSLAKRLEEVVTKKLILTAFESITDTLVRMEEQEINLAYVVLDDQYIYMDEETGKARLICMPSRSAVMETGGVQGFLRNILANAIYLNSEDGDYVAKLLSALNKEMELKSFLRQIHGLMMDAGIEIVEEMIPASETPTVEEITSEPIASEISVAEPITPAPIIPEVMKAEPIIPEVLAPETPVAEPIIPEVLAPETPVAEPIIPEVLAPETLAAEPIIPEVLAPETPAAEPIIPEVLAPETPVAEPVIPEVVVPETPAVEPIPAKPQTGVSFPAEDDIEFEPMPEEMNAKIQRMNIQSAPQNVSAAPTASASQSQPVQLRTSSPQSQPVQPGVSSPQSQPVQSGVSSPQSQLVQPMPQIIPQDATFQQQKRPNPHLVRLKTGENISLPEEKLVIGKSRTGVDYVIQDNAAISRIHCTIMKRNGAYYVRDEKSTNGTFVNGEQVPSETERLLLNNCKLTLGDEEFLYSLW